MFGYVTPCKMELKIKEYEKFKAYYCGLCKSIKKIFGELPRLTINYDMTFLAILLDSLKDEKNTYKKERCIVHPIKKKIIITSNEAIDYAAFFNISLSYYKLLDNVQDDNSLKSKVTSKFLKRYITDNELNKHNIVIEDTLNKLYNIEKNYKNESIDEISHHFAHITGYILSSYKDFEFNEQLYWLGYNLGKWIYIIDAYNDLKDDLEKNKFNAINSVYNKNNLPYEEFKNEIKNRIDFLLVTCGKCCLQNLNKLPLVKNKGLLYNILQLGMVEKMDKILKGVEENEQSI